MYQRSYSAGVTVRGHYDLRTTEGASGGADDKDNRGLKPQCKDNAIYVVTGDVATMSISLDYTASAE